MLTRVHLRARLVELWCRLFGHRWLNRGPSTQVPNVYVVECVRCRAAGYRSWGLFETAILNYKHGWERPESQD